MQDVRTDREKYIGGSDIPAIMGISPFRTRMEVLREKALGEMGDFEGNEYTEYGNALEPKIRDYVNAIMQADFQEAKFVDGIKRYHADGWDGKTNTVLEIKTTGKYDDTKRRMYLAQLLFGMQMAGAESGVLAVYDRPVDFDESFNPFALQVEEVNIKDHTDFLARINQAVDNFIVDIEKMRENPNLSPTDLLPSSITAMAYFLEDMESQLKEYEKVKADYDLMKESLRKAMIEYGVKSWETPSNTKITLVLDGEDKVEKVFDAKRFAEENPIMYNHYLVEKVKKGRKGYVKVTYRERKDN